jgi:hypothetical protein
LVKEKAKENDDDLLLTALIHEGKDEKIDRVIKYLQNFLETKRPPVMFARLSGVDGMRISRAAFAVMIKFSEFFEDFQTIVDETDLQYEMLKDEPERDAQVKE